MVDQQQYRIVVAGELGARYASAFEGMAISTHDGITEMTGSIVDPAQMQGLLDRIVGLGLTLRSLTPVDMTDLDPTSKGP
jgi:hypothetical protein